MATEQGPSRRAIVTTAGILLLISVVGSVVALVALRPKPLDLYKPSAEESRAAATTIPIPAEGCATFARVEQATAIAADETAFGWNPKATPAKARKALGDLHVALANAERYAQGPLRRRLRNAELSIVGAQFAIAAWRGVVPKNELVTPLTIAGDRGDRLSQMRVSGYTHLRVAERLLGSNCGGRLAPDAERVLFAPPRSTTAPSRHPSSTDRA